MPEFIDQNAQTTEAPVDFVPGGRVVGNPQDDIRRRQAQDPANTEDVTDDEQEQYDDFVARALLLIADHRVPEGGDKSPSDATLDIMRNSSFSIPEALAAAASQTVMLIHNNAKRQGVEYSPDVMFHGADEIIASLYVLGAKAGVFEGESVPQQTGDEFDFSEEALKDIAEAKMLAVERFGQMMQESGQLSPELQSEAADFWQTQISRETESGEADGLDVSDEAVGALRAQVSGGRRFV